jgi:hypothetical protein
MTQTTFHVSFPLRLHDGTEHDVEGTAVAVWREWLGPEYEDGLAALDQLTLVSVVVDGMVLNDEQLRRFQDVYRPMYEETLLWIAMSVAEARVPALH